MVTHRLQLPTLRHWAGYPRTPVYLTLQPMACTAVPVTRNAGELLPHLLTLTTPWHGGLSLLHSPTVTDPFPLGSMAPCVARTFLHPPRKQVPCGGDRLCLPDFYIKALLISKWFVKLTDEKKCHIDKTMFIIISAAFSRPVFPKSRLR